MCTMKSFPTRIEHVIEWARGQFQKFFTLFPSACVEYARDRTAFFDALDGGDHDKVSGGKGRSICMDGSNQFSLLGSSCTPPPEAYSPTGWFL